VKILYFGSEFTQKHTGNMDPICCKSFGPLTTLLLISPFPLFGALFPDEDVCRFLQICVPIYQTTRYQTTKHGNFL